MPAAVELAEAGLAEAVRVAVAQAAEGPVPAGERVTARLGTVRAPRPVARPGRGAALLAFVCSLAAVLVPVAAPAGSLKTNEAYIEEALAPPQFDIDDIDAVFDHVFAQLAGAVTVYPTENYYYFKFLHGGTPYAGNLRLDAADRDRGIVHVSYFNELNVFGEEVVWRHRAYGAADGVVVAKVGDLAYSVTRGGKTVVFNLNDLRGVRPPATIVREGEAYIGPVFDESGVRFFLLWNARQRMFLYVLDESAAGDTLFRPAVSRQVAIGLRSGFAFYRDRYFERWILVGVLRQESRLNTYFDGPFDQLPDNFVAGDALRDAFLALSPDVAGRIDRFGNALDLSGRMLAKPYILYDRADDLAVFDQCAARAGDPDPYYRCFAVGQDGTAEAE